MDAEGLPISKKVVVTTPIIPSYSEHPTVELLDGHIVLRRLQVEDLQAFHELRTQYEVMQWTSTGKVDADIPATQGWMARFMEMEEDFSDSPEGAALTQMKKETVRKKTFCFSIVYRDILHALDEPTKASEKVIGSVGCHSVEPMAECGYMIRKEYWGQGVATVVLRAFLELYWKLERTSITRQSLTDDHELNTELNDGLHEEPITIREAVTAVVVATNTGSKRVLEKCGFLKLWQETVLERGADVVLEHHALGKP